MGIIRTLWLRSSGIGMGSLLLFAIFFAAIISCTNDDRPESPALNASQSGELSNFVDSEVPNWFASVSDGTRVSVGDVIPPGSPAILYFFAPG
jgi:hypothetical protein